MGTPGGDERKGGIAVDATFADLVGFLKTTGWSLESRGSSGATWQRQEAILPVLDDLSSGDYEWELTVGRIASATSKDVDFVGREIARMYVDVQEFRAADDVFIKGSIPLEAGFSLFSTARTLMRAAAVTARGNRPVIGSGYGQAAVRLADQARFGHTIDGSYVVPLLMPLDRPNEALIASSLDFEKLGILRSLDEPAERRTTRTLAQALTAIWHGIVEPGREPTKATVDDLVATGVSREMVLAVERIVGSEGVSRFDVRFDWAGGYEPPPGGLDEVSIGHDSAEVLKLAAAKFEVPTKSPFETLSGQIIDLEDDPETPGGRATIRTFRRGRQVRVDIPIDQRQTDLAHQWFRDHRHVAVTGVVRTIPSRPARVDQISQLAPLDELVLFADDAESYIADA